MISSKHELKRILILEKEFYCSDRYGEHDYIKNMIKNDIFYQTGKYIKALRVQEYYYSKRKSIVGFLLWVLASRRKNRLGARLGVEISEGSFEEGLIIWHPQSIVVNANARIGKNCQLHGNNCIGNKGDDKGVPIIGSNVDIGVGAKILGDITIADNCKIGAGAVVINSVLEPNSTIIGIPGKAIKKHNFDEL